VVLDARRYNTALFRDEHDELEPDSEMFHSVAFGWPAVISAMKTLLETGKIGTMAAQKRS
jgi:hypothetical protein